MSIIDRVLIRAQAKLWSATMSVSNAWVAGWRTAENSVRLTVQLVASRLPRKDIAGVATEDPMMTRYRLATALGCEAVLHQWYRGDDYVHMHNHPWRWCVSFVLCGSYAEDRIEYTAGKPRYRMIKRKAGTLSLIGPETFHLIQDAEPGTWTLFVHGPKVRTWGFLTRVNPRAVVPSAQYIAAYQTVFRSKRK